MEVDKKLSIKVGREVDNKKLSIKVGMEVNNKKLSIKVVMEVDNKKLSIKVVIGTREQDALTREQETYHMSTNDLLPSFLIAVICKEWHRYALMEMRYGTHNYI